MGWNSLHNIQLKSKKNYISLYVIVMIIICNTEHIQDVIYIAKGPVTVIKIVF